MRLLSNKIDEKWMVFAVVALTIIMATLDASIVNIALPIIRAEFNVDITIVEWVVIGYMLTIISLLMVFGRAADIYGQKKIFIFGIIIFTISSTLCAFAPSITGLVIFRVLQGVGAACCVANGNAIITRIFPPQERGKALGLVGTTVAIGLSSGPVLGGVITTYLGWRYIFIFNLPLGLISILMAKAFLKDSEKAEGVKFDFVGAIALTTSLIALMLALTKYHDLGVFGNSFMLALSVIAFIVFVYVEIKVDAPMIDLKLFRDDRFTSANIAAFLNFASRFSVIFLLPFYLVDLRGMKPSIAGMMLTPVPLLFAFLAPFSGILSDRIGTRLLTVSGMMITAIGFGMYIFITENSSIIFLLVPLILMGIGGGLFSSPNTSTIMGSVPKNRLGNAGAMTALVRNIGMVVGMAWSGALFTALRGHDTDFMESIHRIVPAFQAAMIISTALAILAAVASFKRSEMTVHSIKHH